MQLSTLDNGEVTRADFRATCQLQVQLFRVDSLISSILASMVGSDKGDRCNHCAAFFHTINLAHSEDQCFYTTPIPCSIIHPVLHRLEQKSY